MLRIGGLGAARLGNQLQSLKRYRLTRRQRWIESQALLARCVCGRPHRFMPPARQ
jgi:hypothetical protein